MNKPPPVNQRRGVSNFDAIATERLSQKINEDLSKIQVQEAKTWSKCLAVLGAMAVWIIFITAVVAVFYLVTRSDTVTISFSVAILLPMTLIAAKILIARLGGTET